MSLEYICTEFFAGFFTISLSYWLRKKTGTGYGKLFRPKQIRKWIWTSRESYSRGSPLPGVLDPTSDLLRRPIVELKGRNLLALVPSRYEIIWRSYELSRFLPRRRDMTSVTWDKLWRWSQVATRLFGEVMSCRVFSTKLNQIIVFNPIFSSSPE